MGRQWNVARCAAWTRALPRDEVSEANIQLAFSHNLQVGSQLLVVRVFFCEVLEGLNLFTTHEGKTSSFCFLRHLSQLSGSPHNHLTIPFTRCPPAFIDPARILARPHVYTLNPLLSACIEQSHLPTHIRTLPARLSVTQSPTFSHSLKRTVIKQAAHRPLLNYFLSTNAMRV